MAVNFVRDMVIVNVVFASKSFSNKKNFTKFISKNYRKQNSCRCKSTEEGRYSGKYCEKCPTCAGRCHELKDCVQCQMYKTGPLKDEKDCAANCSNTFVPIGEEKIVIDEEKDELLCIFYDEDDCKFTFKYSEVNDKIEVHAQQERECPPKVFMLGIVLGVIAAIVLVGLAILLLWKLLTTIHDRREFARFEKERMNAKWDTVSLVTHTNFELFFILLRELSLPRRRGRRPYNRYDR